MKRRVKQDSATLGKILISVLLVMAFAAAGKWMGFTADEIVTFFGGALMLAGMLAACHRRPPD
ncbi:MAG TPA: hypothetical protein VF062_15255 [Candidatus Limnocylindrales bacterium]